MSDDERTPLGAEQVRAEIEKLPVGWDEDDDEVIERAAVLALLSRLSVSAPKDNPALISREHPEGICEKCGGPNICWHTDSLMWNQYARAAGFGVLCPLCYAGLVEAVEPHCIWHVTNVRGEP